MIQQALKLNMIPESAPVILNVDQYDTGTGRIVAELYKGATPYTPGAGATAKIQGTKPDMHGFQYDATLSGSTVTADLVQQMSCVAGNVRTQIVITETSGRTGTFAFIMRVQASALDDDTITSDTELPDIIDAAEHNADRAEAAADRAEAASLHYPYIGANKNWYEWDPATEQYIDTGIKAEGSVYNAGLGIDITGDVISVDADNTPTDGSMKPITSNAVYDGLALKQDNLTAGSFIDITGNVISATYTDATQNDSGLMSAADKTKLDGIESGAEVNVQADWNEADNTKDDYIKNKPTLGTAAAKDATNAVTLGSTDLVESGAVKTAIDTAISAVYKPAGDKTCAELTASLLVAANLGNVYNTTDAGTTTADFVGGAGRTISIGDNVAIVDVGGGTYKFDLLAGMVDLTAYQTKNLTTAVESQSTVEGALGALSSNKQPKTLSSAITVDGTQETTVESALSAINTLAAANKSNKQDKTLSSTIESQSTVEGALSALSSNKQPKTLSTPITVDGTSETTVEGTLGAINDLAAANKTAIGNLGTAAAKDATDTIASGSTDLIESGSVYTALNGKQDTLSAGTGIDITSNTVSVDADATPTDGSNKPVTSNGVYDALALKQDTLTFDNVPTASSNNPVKSGGVYAADKAQEQLLTDTTGWKCVNLLPITLANMKRINTKGTWAGNVYTYGNIDYTVNTDKNGYVTEVIVNGNNSANSNIVLSDHNTEELDFSTVAGESVIMSGCPSGGSADTYSLYGYRVGGGTINARDTGDGATFTFRSDNNTWNIAIAITTGASVNNLVFKPMLRYAIYKDLTEYYTYHPSVDECKCDNSAIAPVEDGTTFSQAYIIGQHFTRNGAFCTLTANVAQNDTILDNTPAQFTAGDVASTLWMQTVSSIDVDTLKTTGRYMLNGNITNVPEGNYGFLDVLAHRNGSILHIYQPIAWIDKVYRRKFENNSWSAWYLFTGTVVS